MKQFFLILIGIIYTTTLNAHNLSADYLTSKFNNGYPLEASFFIEQYKPTHPKYAYLKTSTDSIKVLIGSFVLNKKQDYYALIFYNNRFDFTTFSIEKNDSSKMLTKKLDFKVNNATKLLSLQVQHNPLTDEFFYIWLNPNGRSKIASMQLEGLIHLNKPMPYFEAKSLNEKIISFEELKGKYLIMNWWSTTCGPCIAEIPSLNNIVEKYKSRSDVVFLAIAWDEKEKLERFLTKKVFKYQQSYDKRLSSLFGESFPKHIIVNPQGIVTYYKSGLEYEIGENLEIETAIENQLKKN